MRKGRKRKKFALILVAAITLLMLCGFGYASRIDMTYEDGVWQISVYNPNPVDEYEQWSMEYLADGYEITQIGNMTWMVSNENNGFFLTQLSLSENTSGLIIPGNEYVPEELQILENITYINEEYIKETRMFCWKTQECMYAVVVFAELEEKNFEIVAMIQSITP